MYENDSGKEEHLRDIERYEVYQSMESERNEDARATFVRKPYYCERSKEDGR